VNSTNVFFL